jgi:hypothetical protein
VSSEKLGPSTTRIEIQVPAGYPDLIQEIQGALGEQKNTNHYILTWLEECIIGDVSRIHDLNPDKGLELIRRFDLGSHFKNILPVIEEEA